MTPASSSFVSAAKAAARGTKNRQALLQWRMPLGSAKRWLTLPPGSVRGVPSFEEFQDSHSCIESNENDSRARVQMRMCPQRNYATFSEILPQKDTGHFDSIASFGEDYDDWGAHSSAGNPTNCNLGRIYEEDAADVFSTTLTGDVVRFSDLSSFSANEEDYFTALERKLGISDLANDTIVDGGDGHY